jgi:hypothetical protein
LEGAIATLQPKPFDQELIIMKLEEIDGKKKVVALDKKEEIQIKKAGKPNPKEAKGVEVMCVHNHSYSSNNFALRKIYNIISLLFQTQQH